MNRVLHASITRFGSWQYGGREESKNTPRSEPCMCSLLPHLSGKQFLLQPNDKRCMLRYDLLIRGWTLACTCRLHSLFKCACWRTKGCFYLACTGWNAEHTHQQTTGEAYPSMTNSLVLTLFVRTSALSPHEVHKGVGTVFLQVLQLITQWNAFQSSPYAFRFDSTTDSVVCDSTLCFEGRWNFVIAPRPTHACAWIRTKPEKQELG